MGLKFFMVLVKFLSTKKRKAHIMEKDFYRRAFFTRLPIEERGSRATEFLTTKGFMSRLASTTALHLLE